MRKNPWLGWTMIAMLVLAASPLVRADFDSAMNQFRAGKYHEAAAEFQELVDTSPNYDFGYYMLGLSFLQVKKPADAEKNLLKAIELNGDKFEYHHSLAKTYYDQKQYPKAVAALKTAEGLATEAKYKYALYSLRGLSYSAEEKWAEAIQDLEEARKIKASAAVLDRLALAYYELGYNDKALPLMRESLKQTPNTAMQVRLTNTLLNMGAESRDAAAKSKYYEEAMVLADKLRAGKPNSADANNLAGRAALGAKKYAQAEAAFKKVLALDSDHCYAMANLGKTYLAQTKWTDAESILNDATKCAPRMDVAWDSLGFALQKQKRLPDAIAAYERAYAINPRQSTKSAIETCQQNIEIAQHNKEMDAEAARQKAEEEAEAARIAAEQAKREEWKKKQEDDD